MIRPSRARNQITMPAIWLRSLSYRLTPARYCSRRFIRRSI
ncbi:hypothetical protein [Spongiactinospora rosea]|nr:hypothetical protein [Spongiactinospora rosea]